MTTVHGTPCNLLVKLLVEKEMSYPNLRAEMARDNITQLDIADYLGYRVGTINAWINGHDSGFPIKKASDIKEHFFPNLTIDYLFAETPTEPSRPEDN